MAKRASRKSESLDLPVANPGVSWEWLINLLLVLLKPIVKIVSEEIRDLVEEGLVKLYQKAEKTENPWDDFLVGLLLRILGIDIPEA